MSISGVDEVHYLEPAHEVLTHGGRCSRHFGRVGKGSDGVGQSRDVRLISDSFEGKRRIEAAQVIDIARHDDGPFATSDKHDRGIDDVCGADAAAKHAGRFGQKLIEKRNARRRPFDESAERRLPRRTSPNLTEDAGRDDQTHTGPERLANERPHARVAALEGDQGAGV
jgi:hypothetical protein